MDDLDLFVSNLYLDGLSPKVASDDRVGRIADRVDDVGIGLLAAPYAADLAGSGLQRAGKSKVLPAKARAAAALAGEVLQRKAGTSSPFGHSKARELGGLALVAPGVTHGVAKTIAGKEKEIPKSKLAAYEHALRDFFPELEDMTDPAKQEKIANILSLVGRGVQAARKAAPAARKALSSASKTAPTASKTSPSLAKTVPGAGPGTGSHGAVAGMSPKTRAGLTTGEYQQRARIMGRDGFNSVGGHQQHMADRLQTPLTAPKPRGSAPAKTPANKTAPTKADTGNGTAATSAAAKSQGKMIQGGDGVLRNKADHAAFIDRQAGAVESSLNVKTPVRGSAKATAPNKRVNPASQSPAATAPQGRAAQTPVSPTAPTAPTGVQTPVQRAAAAPPVSGVQPVQAAAPAPTPAIAPAAPAAPAAAAAPIPATNPGIPPTRQGIPATRVGVGAAPVTPAAAGATPLTQSRPAVAPAPSMAPAATGAVPVAPAAAPAAPGGIGWKRGLGYGAGAVGLGGLALGAYGTTKAIDAAHHIATNEEQPWATPAAYGMNRVF